MSTWGNRFNISIFGESHGPAIGVVVDGLPAGEIVDLDELAVFCARRAPGHSSTATRRKEADVPEVLSGLHAGRTTGAPLAVLIKNNDTHSTDYDNLRTVARPGHADFTGFVRYNGANDVRGGGHFSGRLTAPLVAAGGIAKQLLSGHGVEIGAHIYSVRDICDAKFDPMCYNPELILAPGQKPFPVLDDEAGARMIAAIEAAAKEQNSLGGIVECCALGLPAGIGDPMFDGVENVLSSILFGIPAVKGVEFGAGFSAAQMTGAEHNDAFVLDENGEICTATNRHGGILGGITSGMPILVRAAFKPTPSISRPQQSVDFVSRTPQELTVHGRHDPCIVPRAVPCVEAAVALGLLSMVV